MKMVQLSLALACLLAGADAFGVTPPEVTKPTDGPPAFIVHEGVGWCRSNLNENMEWYVGEDGSFEDGVDKTADKCWKACQAKNPVVGRFHDFFNDGKKTWCYCQSGCECMEDVGVDNTLAPPDWKPPSACLPPVPPPECECQDMWIDEDCSGTTQKGCPITNCEGDTRSWCYLKATPCTVGPDDKTYDYYYGGYDNDPTTMPNWMYCTPASPASPAFIVHNEVGWCQSDLDDMMWEGMLDGEGLLDGENSEDTRTIAGGGLTADDCWTACQAKYPVVGSTHEFGNDGKETWCFCQNGCECMNDVGESNTLAPPGWKAADACVIDVVETVPKFSEYNDKCAPSENDFPAWTLEGTFVGTAKECWEECQRHGEQNSGDNPNPVPSHQFLDWTKSGGGTECYCKTSCDCFDEEGEGACNTPLNNGAAGVGVLTNNAQNGECACEGQDFNEVQCNAIGCCNFGGAPADGGDGCSSAVGPGPCYSRRRLAEEPAAHTTL